jgi:hypothetical protein
MQARAVHVWTRLPLLLGLIGPALGQGPPLGWPESVAALTVERSKAETCVSLLKSYGDQAQMARGKLAYAQTKGQTDAVIAGLVTALADGGEPESLPSLEVRLKQGTAASSPAPFHERTQPRGLLPRWLQELFASRLQDSIRGTPGSLPETVHAYSL